jgi:methionyl-tRNA formyltransferase
MKIVCFVNNLVGLRVLQYLKERGEDIAAVVVHPNGKAKYGQEIAMLADGRLINGAKLRDPETIQTIRDLQPEIGVSAYFGYILQREMLDIFPRGVLNLHPAFLPYNRGANPNVWPIIEGTPAGVTLHWMDEGIDTGPIVLRSQEPVYVWDTGESLYCRLENLALKTFAESWPNLDASLPQEYADATTHRLSDSSLIDEIDLDRETPPRLLINRLRARTFPPYKGCYFLHEGKRVYVRVSFEQDHEPTVTSEQSLL